MPVRPQLTDLLTRERPALDQIFGVGAYQIESAHPHEAVVRTNGLAWRIGYDRRDGSIGSALAATGLSPEVEAVPDVWAQFLEQEIPPLPRDVSGHIKPSAEAQLRNELEWIGRLWSEVFSDPLKTRDAASFVRGYHKAYNDWASGAWDATD